LAVETAPLVVRRLEDRRVLACTSSIACLDEDGSFDPGDSIGPNAIGDPVVTVPGTQSTTEGAALVFSAATGNEIRVDDPDIGANPLTVQIGAFEVTGGYSPNITLGSTAGLISISGNGSNLIQLQGTLSAINAALSHVTFYSVDDGNYSITVSADDPSTGGSDSKTFSVLAANALPQIELDNASGALEEGSLIDLSIQVIDPGTYDSPTTSWAVVYQGTQIAQGVGSHVAFIPPNDGDYEITVNAVDKDGGAAMIQEHLFVENVLPESDVTGFVREGITYLTVHIKDPGADLFTIDVYWSSDDTVPDVIMTTQRVVTLSHDYSLDEVPPGDLSIVVQVSDGGGFARAALSFEQVSIEVSTQPEIEPIVTSPPPERSAAVRPRLDGATPQVNSAQIAQGSVVGRQENPAIHQFVVRLVGPDGEESGSFPLAYEALANLPAFFASIGLPDGHYRVYLVTGELERLVVDAHLRSGRLIDPAAESLAALDGAPGHEVVGAMPGVTDGVELNRFQASLLANTETVAQSPVDETATAEIAQISADDSAPQIVAAATTGAEQDASTAEQVEATLRWTGPILVGLGVCVVATARTHSVRTRTAQPRRNRFTKAARLARRIARQCA
jgi:hypothetical protein